MAERPECVHETAFLLYNRIIGNIEYGRERLKYIVDKEASQEKEETIEQEDEQTVNNIDLTPQEVTKALWYLHFR